MKQAACRGERCGAAAHSSNSAFFEKEKAVGDEGSVTGDSLTKFNMLDDAAASTSGSDAAPVDPDAAAAVREFNDWATSHSEELKHMPEPDAKLALIKEYNR